MKRKLMMKSAGKYARGILVFMLAACLLTGCEKEESLLTQLAPENGYAAGGEAADTGEEDAEEGNSGAGVRKEETSETGTSETGSPQTGLIAEGKTAEDGAPEPIYVHICGAVNAPGVYELPPGSRFFEAVEAAGGFTEDASRDYLNMARVLEDGSRLRIPTMKEAEAAGAADLNENTAAQTEAAGADAGGASDAEGLVNLNTADITQLCTLPGVGESRAKAIIEYREKEGGFQKKEDIMEVSGIGEKMYAKMEAYLTV